MHMVAWSLDYLLLGCLLSLVCLLKGVMDPYRFGNWSLLMFLDCSLTLNTVPNMSWIFSDSAVSHHAVSGEAWRHT